MSKRKKIFITSSFVISLIVVFVFFYLRPSPQKKQQSQQNNVLALEEDVENMEAYQIQVEAILQKPELPTGCEVTSLATVLQYWDYEIDKCDLADSFLEKGKIGETDFRKAFVGNPRSESSYGCYAEVIEKCANDYLISVDSTLKVENITGSEFEHLYKYIQTDIPVIVWTTVDLKKPYKTTTWHVDGKDLTWLKNEHCVVLTGYDQEKVYVCDPLKGNVTYDADVFEERFEQLYSQAVVIYGR